MDVRKLTYSLFINSFAGTAYAQEELRDIKDPILFTDNLDYPKIIIALLIILFSIGIYYLVRSRMKKRPEAPKITKTPAQVALLKLSELKSRSLPQNGKLKEYFTILADILRRYIEDQFNVRAPEMTTEEFLISIDKEYKVDQDHMGLLKKFLMCCDMVKFAKHDARNNEVDSTFESAVTFINETKEAREELVRAQ